MQATYDDANLILRLYEIRREEALRKARAWFAASFSAATPEEMLAKYPYGSQENTNIRMVLSYWEMVCSFVTAGVLNQELLFESTGELLTVWEKVRQILPAFRKMTKDPQSWHNLETVGNAFIKLMEARSPEAYRGMQEMMSVIAASMRQS